MTEGIRYSGGLYLAESRLDEERISRALAGLEELGLGFFPAEMALSAKRRVAFSAAAEFRRSLVPRPYFIEPDVARIPLECANGMDITFTESDAPDLYPASFGLSFGAGLLRDRGWGLEELLRIFRAAIPSLDADYGWLYDEAQNQSPSYQRRRLEVDIAKIPVELSWINYFGPSWAMNVGLERLQRIRPHVAAFEEFQGGGVLVAIQREPYDEGNPGHRAHRGQVEEILGLAEVHTHFPKTSRKRHN